MGKDKWIANQNWPAFAIGYIRAKLGGGQRIATVEEAAKAIGVSRANLYLWMKAGTMREAKDYHITRVVELSGVPRDWLVQGPPRRGE